LDHLKRFGLRLCVYGDIQVTDTLEDEEEKKQLFEAAMAEKDLTINDLLPASITSSADIMEELANDRLLPYNHPSCPLNHPETMEVPTATVVLGRSHGIIARSGSLEGYHGQMTAYSTPDQLEPAIFPLSVLESAFKSPRTHYRMPRAGRRDPDTPWPPMFEPHPYVPGYYRKIDYEPSIRDEDEERNVYYYHVSTNPYSGQGFFYWLTKHEYLDLIYRVSVRKSINKAITKAYYRGVYKFLRNDWAGKPKHNWIEESDKKPAAK
jgi:hypothetical protein